MKTRFNVGDEARANMNLGYIDKGQIVTITGVKVEVFNGTLNGKRYELMETVSCKELASCGFSEQKWVYESCFDGPLRFHAHL